MSLESLLTLVKKLRKQIDDDVDTLDETKTRYRLINPLLRELGWDPESRVLVTPEYKVGSGSADYALLNKAFKNNRWHGPVNPCKSQAVIPEGGCMPYANDSGVKLWYDLNGVGEPLVVTGGFGLLHDQFAHVRELLTPHLQVIDWNYRGAGRSDRAWPGGYPFDRWVDDLTLILDQAGLDTVHMWGTSTGAPLNVRFAARHPARVKSLITYPGISFSPESRRMFQVFQDVTETFGYEALGRLTQWIGSAEHNVFGDRANEIALFEIESFKRNFSIPSLAKTLEVFSHCDLSTDVTKLTMSVLVLMGNSGHLGAATPGQTAAIEAFTSLCPHAEVTLIENGGGTYHMIEQPEPTAAIVIDFVNKHTGA